MKPCICWTGPVVLHGGHCCFTESTPIDEIKLGDPPPCGHWHSDVPIPAAP